MTDRTHSSRTLFIFSFEGGGVIEGGQRDGEGVAARWVIGGLEG